MVVVLHVHRVVQVVVKDEIKMELLVLLLVMLMIMQAPCTYSNVTERRGPNNKR